MSTADKPTPAKSYTPELPIRLAPFLYWPMKVSDIVRYFLELWTPLGERLLITAIAILTWYYTSPPLEQTREMAFGWIAQIWVRNAILLLIVCGFLHLYFYTFKKQGNHLKYDPRDLARKSRIFHFNNQVLDNMFWTLVTAPFFATFYETVLMWAYANGIAPYIEFADHPVWFIAILLIIPHWQGMYFYWTHRALHWPPLYKHVHLWHHKNVNTGPWSGLAMHPVEQMILMGDVLFFLVLAAHPIHVICLIQSHLISAPTSHTGFEGLALGKKRSFRLGDYFHHLHHRYFDCNYGTTDMPWDKWFGTFHDGTPESDKAIGERRRILQKKYAKS